jgi:hypothetical protein
MVIGQPSLSVAQLTSARIDPVVGRGLLLVHKLMILYGSGIRSNYGCEATTSDTDMTVSAKIALDIYL